MGKTEGKRLTRERNTYNGKKKVKEKDRKSLKESERKIIQCEGKVKKINKNEKEGTTIKD